MHLPHPRSVLAALPLIVALSACASGGGGSARPAGSNPDRIVQEELSDVGDLNAYDAVQRLRPAWLRVRSSADPPVIYVNGARYGNDLTSLRSFQARAINQMERVSPNDASTRFGTGHTGGAILVTLAGSGE
jgi:hypothetical protein